MQQSMLLELEAPIKVSYISCWDVRVLAHLDVGCGQL